LLNFAISLEIKRYFVTFIQIFMFYFLHSKEKFISYRIGNQELLLQKSNWQIFLGHFFPSFEGLLDAICRTGNNPFA